MTHQELNGPSPSQLRQVDEIADKYESDCKESTRPMIEDFLSEHADLHPFLLLELLILDMQIRLREGGVPDLNDYRTRFPDSGKLIDQAYQQARHSNTNDRVNDETAPIPKGGYKHSASLVVQQFQRSWSQQHAKELTNYIPSELNYTDRSKLVKELILVDIQQRRDRDIDTNPSLYQHLLGKYPDSVQQALTRSSLDQIDATTPPQRSIRPARSRGQLSSPPSDDASRYRILSRHAEGGLGVIYRARDEQLKREVALKEIKGKAARNANCRERFLFEAEVTGVLQHPGIVPVYGLGIYDDRRPYYAMRFIHGESLKSSIDEFHRTWKSDDAKSFYRPEFKSILHRFIDVCFAIHYAHRHGILHRDIKPDNVMLGKYGETFVVDWGLAKVRDESHAPELSTQSIDVEASHSDATMRGQVVGTPTYMSPEQAAGVADLDERSDVYSLGATLFTLISGQRPVDGRSTAEVIRDVKQGKVKDLRSIAKHAPPALVTICQKAMALQPDMRYASAKLIAADVELWLADELVPSHQTLETWSERWGRRIRRNHTVSVFGAVTLLTLTITVSVAAVLVTRAWQSENQAKDQALLHYQRSRESIDKWLVGTDEALKFFPGMQHVRRQLLEQAQQDYMELVELSNGLSDPVIELEAARAITRVGMIQQEQEQFEKAADSFHKALKIVSDATKHLSHQQTYRREAAEIHIRLAFNSVLQNNHDAAEAAYRKAIEILESLDNSNFETVKSMLIARQHLAELKLDTLQKPAEAVELLRKGIEMDSTSLPDSLQLVWANHLHLLGRAHLQVGNLQIADEELLASSKSLRVLAEQEPENLDFHQASAAVLDTHAKVLLLQGRLNDEQQAREDSLRKYQLLFEAKRDEPMKKEAYAVALINFGISDYENGRVQQAIEKLESAVKLLSQLGDSYPNIRRFFAKAAICYDALGRARLDVEQDPNQGLEEISIAVATLSDLAANSDTDELLFDFAVARGHQAFALACNHQVDDANLCFQHAIEIIDSLLEKQGNNLELINTAARLHQQYGNVLYDQDASRQEAAIEQFVKAREYWRSLIDSEISSATNPRHSHAQYLHDFACFLLTCPHPALQDFEVAKDVMEKALRSAQQNPRFFTTLALANASLDNGEEALQLLKQVKSNRGLWKGRDYFVLSLATAKTGDHDEQRRAFDQGVKWMKTHQPYNQELMALRERAEQALIARETDPESRE